MYLSPGIVGETVTNISQRLLAELSLSREKARWLTDACRLLKRVR